MELKIKKGIKVAMLIKDEASKIEINMNLNKV
jgi:hypothetical protein